MTEIPIVVADDEALHRRVRPEFVKPDGSVSSQAFTDHNLSVDRAAYCDVASTLRGFQSTGVVSIVAALARELNQEVLAEPSLLNPAHALVKGKKTKSIARALARSALWAVQIDGEGNQLPLAPTP